MALINCPECGKEISDKSGACPNCGFPLIEGKALETEKTINIKKIGFKKKKVIIISSLVLVVLIIAIVIVSTVIIKPNKLYDEALSLLASGEYSEAQQVIDKIPNHKGVAEIQNEIDFNEAIKFLETGEYEQAKTILETIPNYDGVDSLQEQLLYESYAFNCINEYKKFLKNPDSFQPYEITFYENTLEDDDSSESYPPCVIYYGAQNGFGGNTTGYAVCTYSSETEGYEVVGHCDTLNLDDIDIVEDFMEAFTCVVINSYMDERSTVGQIDMNRIKVLLKNEAYTTIKIIE
jgi:hypothetical protein